VDPSKRDAQAPRGCVGEIAAAIDAVQSWAGGLNVVSSWRTEQASHAAHQIDAIWCAAADYALRSATGRCKRESLRASSRGR
jgi:hypothetical protein